MRIDFTIPGKPVGKGRPRFAKRGNFVHTYTPEQTASYENLVKVMYMAKYNGVSFGKGVPVRMELKVFHPIPVSASKKKQNLMRSGEIRPLVKPDSTNVCKSIEDGLNGVAYDDDTQIVETVIERLYGDDPRVEVAMYEVRKDGCF